MDTDGTVRSPGVEVRELDAQHSGLEGIQTVIYAQAQTVMLCAEAMAAQRTRKLREAIIVAGDQPPVPEGPQILGWKEAETPKCPERSEILVLKRRPNGLRGVFE